MELFSHSHRRLNPLTGDWVLVSPQRVQRPWLGQVESLPDKVPAYDPACYLCPGNVRANGQRNPTYTSTFVFDNDYAALLPVSSGEAAPVSDLLRARPERGICRVICFSPRHDLTLSQMSHEEIGHVVDAWVAQTRELGALDFVNYVQIFENKGALMGASNPHPHGQVWATEHTPSEPAKELRAQAEYWQTHNACLLCEYLSVEARDWARIVIQNDHFVVVVPFWAVWPFETMLLPRRHLGALTELTDAECAALADIIKRLTTCYDKLFNVSFPYSMGFHQTPTDGKTYPEVHLHAHYYPPLLRSATIRKFMVGYEMLAEPQRDLTPESAAERLRTIVNEIRNT